jgi:hypothetical protein
MAYALRPGESLMRCWTNWGLYFCTQNLEEPKRYGNGRFLLEVPLEGEAWRQGVAVAGVTASGSPRALAADGEEGTLTYRFESPWPILAGRVVLEGVADGEGSVELMLRVDGRWRELWTSTGADLSADEPLRGYFRNGYGNPTQAFDLRVVLKGGARVTRLAISRDVQVAPGSLPALRRGENTIRYVAASAGDVECTFGYDVAGE